MWFVHWLSARLTTAAWFSQISDHLQDRLQSISNADAHLVFSAWQSEHITPLLCELHWLRLPERITFRLHSGLPMSSWNNSILPRQEPSADIWCRWLLMSTLVCTLLTQPVVLSTMFNAQRLCLPMASACACHHLSGMHCCWRHSIANWRQLLRSSFDDDWPIVIVLHSTTVVCPRLPTVGASVFLKILYDAPAMYLTRQCHFSQYIVTYLLCAGRRRKANAHVKLWTDGTGKAMINNMLLVEYYPLLQDR